MQIEFCNSPNRNHPQHRSYLQGSRMSTTSSFLSCIRSHSYEGQLDEHTFASATTVSSIFPLPLHFLCTQHAVDGVTESFLQTLQYSPSPSKVDSATMILVFPKAFGLHFVFHLFIILSPSSVSAVITRSQHTKLPGCSKKLRVQ